MKKLIAWATMLALGIIPAYTSANDVSHHSAMPTIEATNLLALPAELYKVYGADQVNIRKNDRGGIDVESKPVGRIREFCIEVYEKNAFAVDLYNADWKKYQTLNRETDGSYVLDLYEGGKITYDAATDTFTNTTQLNISVELGKTIANAVAQDLQHFLETPRHYTVAKITDYIQEISTRSNVQTPHISTLPAPIGKVETQPLPVPTPTWEVETQPLPVPAPEAFPIPEKIKMQLHTAWDGLKASLSRQAPHIQEARYTRIVDRVNAATADMPDSLVKSVLLHLKEMAWKEITNLVIARVSDTFNTSQLPFALDMNKYSVHRLDEVQIRGNDRGGFDIDSLRGEYCIEVYADGSYAVDIYEKYTKTQTLDVAADGSYVLDLYEGGKMVKNADGTINNTTKYEPLSDEMVATIRTDLQKILDTDLFYVAKITDYLTAQ